MYWKKYDGLLNRNANIQVQYRIKLPRLNLYKNNFHMLFTEKKKYTDNFK